jgi:hypothetical protein
MGVKQRLIEQAADGTGLDRPFLLNGAPTSGASGSFVGKAVPGSLLIDLSGGKLYVSMNTTTSTNVQWQVAGLQT